MTIQRNDPSAYPFSYPDKPRLTGVSTASLKTPIKKPTVSAARHPGPLSRFQNTPRKNTTKIGGEVDASVIEPYTNKQHHGFLGHSYVGSWVNLGAGTTNSDLKNNYGTIRLWTPRGDEDTGAIKMGCMLGDHVKTGIGLLLKARVVLPFIQLMNQWVSTRQALTSNFWLSNRRSSGYNVFSSISSPPSPSAFTNA